MPSGKAVKRKKNRSSFDFEKAGVTFQQLGDNVLVKSERTPEQHEKLQNTLRNNRPEIFQSLKNDIEVVMSIFQKFDNLKLLGGLEYIQILNHLNKDDDGISELGVEYGLSFSTALSGNPAKPPTKGIILKLSALLKNIRHNYRTYMMTEYVTSNLSELENKIRFKTILQALYLRNEGYMQHVKSIYIDLFSKHDDFFQTKYGFNSNDILETIIQMEDSFRCRIQDPTGRIYSNSYTRFQSWQATKEQDEISEEIIEKFASENPDIVLKQGKIFSYDLSDVSSYPEIFKIRFRTAAHKKVAANISTEFGENVKFLNPKFQGLPLNESIINQKPLIKYNDDYYLFSFSIPFRNLIHIAEYLIQKADNEYYKNKYLGNKYERTRDNFLERKAADIFSVMLPKATIHENVSYRVSKDDETDSLITTELDLLIISPNANYLVEVKAGALAASSKRGALKSLFTNLHESIGYAAFQNYRALKYIEQSATPIFFKNDEEIFVDKSKRTFRITVTMEHFSSLAAYLFDLKELGVIQKGVGFAWTCSIFDLFAFSQILESELDLIEYLEARIPLYENPKLDVHDELDLLGHYLDKGLSFNNAMIDNVKTFQIPNNSFIIDSYFQFGGKKPLKRRD